MVNNKTGTTGEVPRCLLSNIVEQVGGAPWGNLGNTLGEQVIRLYGSLIKAVLSYQGDTGVAPGKGLGVENGLRIVAKLGLGSNILKSDNRAVMTRFVRQSVTKRFTISLTQRHPMEIGLDERTRWSRGASRAPI